MCYLYSLKELSLSNHLTHLAVLLVKIQRFHDAQRVMDLLIDLKGAVGDCLQLVSDMSVLALERGRNVLRYLEVEQVFVFSGFEIVFR